MHTASDQRTNERCSARRLRVFPFLQSCSQHEQHQSTWPHTCTRPLGGCRLLLLRPRLCLCSRLLTRALLVGCRTHCASTIFRTHSWVGSTCWRLCWGWAGCAAALLGFWLCCKCSRSSLCKCVHACARCPGHARGCLWWRHRCRSCAGCGRHPSMERCLLQSLQLLLPVLWHLPAQQGRHGWNMRPVLAVESRHAKGKHQSGGACMQVYGSKPYKYVHESK